MSPLMRGSAKRVLTGNSDTIYYRRIYHLRVSSIFVNTKSYLFCTRIKIPHKSKIRNNIFPCELEAMQ